MVLPLRVELGTSVGTVLTNGDTRDASAVESHRGTLALSAFLADRGHGWCKEVEVVVFDGSAAYKTAIRALFVADQRREREAVWDALGELHNLRLVNHYIGALAVLDRFADIHGAS